MILHDRLDLFRFDTFFNIIVLKRSLIMNFKSILFCLSFLALFASGFLWIANTKAAECVNSGGCSGSCEGWSVWCFPGSATTTMRASAGGCYNEWRKTGNWCGVCVRGVTVTGIPCGQPWAMYDPLYCDGTVP
jgi:hypothetical protein